jgi:hypothetical protein
MAKKKRMRRGEFPEKAPLFAAFPLGGTGGRKESF